MGQNSMRRKLEEDKIMASVSKKIESTTTSTSSQLLAALLQISTSIGSALTSWQMQLALPNCSADIQRQYYDLLVKKQIEAMTRDDESTVQYSNVTPTDLIKVYAASTTPETPDDNANIANRNRDTDECIDVSKEVPGTIQPLKFNTVQ
jgi:hypothetical protein